MLFFNRSNKINNNDRTLATKTYIHTKNEHLLDASDNPSVAMQPYYFQFAAFSCYAGQPDSGRSQQIKNHLFNNCLDHSLCMLSPKLLPTMPLTTLVHNNSPAAEFIDLIADKGGEEDATHIILENNAHFAINPFESKMGFSRPIHFDRWQLIEFLRVLLKPKPYIPRPFVFKKLLQDLIDKLFEQVTGDDATHAKMYVKGVNSTLDTVVHDYRVTAYYNPQPITLTELTRKLHIAGGTWKSGGPDNILLWKARDIAYSMSAPVLSDLYAVIDSPEICEAHTINSVCGQPILDVMRDTITQAITDYPCFANPTTIRISSTPAVAIDLKNVLNDDARNNSLFILAAHMLALKRINITDHDLSSPFLRRDYLSFYKKTCVYRLHSGAVVAFDNIDLGVEEGLSRLLSSSARERKKLRLELVVGVNGLDEIECESNHFPPIIYLQKLCMFTQPTAEQIEVFKHRFTSTPQILQDLSLVDDNNYFSYTTPHINDDLLVVKTDIKRKPHRAMSFS